MVVKDEFCVTYPHVDSDMEVRTYYKVVFPTDELGDGLPKRLTFGGFAKRFKAGHTIDDISGVSDSVVRERLTHALEYVLVWDFDTIYNEDFLNHIRGRVKNENR